MSFIGDLFGMGGDPKAMQLPNWQGAAGNAFGGIQDLSKNNTFQNVLPNIGALTGQAANNPYAAGVQASANATSQFGQGVGQGVGQAVGQGAQGIAGLTGSVVPYANQILQTGFDPQNELYNRTAQRLTDQTRAGQSARGIAMSPYGAGLENKAMSDFNIDWQNSMLDRQNSALQGFNAGVQGGVGAGQGAIGLGQGAMDAYGQGASMPYQTYNDIINKAVGAYNTYGQAGQNANITPGQEIGSWLNYVGQGNNANANGLKQQGQNQSFFGDLLGLAGGFFGL